MFAFPLLGSILFALSPQAAPQPSSLKAEKCDVGEVVPFSVARCDLAISNNGDSPVRITGIESLRAGVKGRANEIVVPEHGQAYMAVTIDVGNAAGVISFPFGIKTDQTGRDRVAFRVDGFSLPDIDQSRPELDFKLVELTKPLPKREVTLTSVTSPDFHVLKVLDAPEWVDAAVGEGNTVIVAPKQDAPLGMHDGFVKLAIASARQHEAWVRVKADIQGDIAPQSNPFDLGVMRVGSENSFLIRFTSRAGKGFKISKATLEGFKGKVKPLACVPRDAACAMVKLTVSKEQVTGGIKGVLWVEVPGHGGRVPVNLWGLLAPKNFEIKKLDGTSEGEGANSSPTKSEALNVANVLKGVADSAAGAKLPPPVGKGPLLKWTVGNGSTLYGFQIFRADQEAGPYKLMTPSPIRAVKSDDPLTYQWRDVGAEQGVSHWYYIGQVADDGNKKRLSEPKEVVAK